MNSVQEGVELPRKVFFFFERGWASSFLTVMMYRLKAKAPKAKGPECRPLVHPFLAA